MSTVNNCEDEKAQEEMELADTMSREVFEPVEKVFNMQKRRVTDLAHKAYIILPPAQTIEYESLLELRRQKQRKYGRLDKSTMRLELTLLGQDSGEFEPSRRLPRSEQVNVQKNTLMAKSKVVLLRRVRCSGSTERIT